MLTVFALGLVALTCIMLVPQTLGYYLARFEKRDRKVGKVKYWDGDNWLYGFFMLIGLVMVFGVVFMLGLITCVIFGINPL